MSYDEYSYKVMDKGNNLCACVYMCELIAFEFVIRETLKTPQDDTFILYLNSALFDVNIIKDSITIVLPTIRTTLALYRQFYKCL